MKEGDQERSGTGMLDKDMMPRGAKSMSIPENEICPSLDESNAYRPVNTGFLFSRNACIPSA